MIKPNRIINGVIGLIGNFYLQNDYKIGLKSTFIFNIITVKNL